MNANSLNRLIGSVVILLGITSMIVALLWAPRQALPAPADTLSSPLPYPTGNLAALSVFLLFVGMALQYPSMLREDSNSVSSLRVLLFVVTGMFCLLTTKAAWGANTLSQLAINGTWAALLATLVGGKAAQSFSEAKSTLGGASLRGQLRTSMPLLPPDTQPPA